MKLRDAISPPAEEGRHDTGLRFTDVLFGFVIRELFVRLQNWDQLAGYTRWQLIVGTTLVLGSWLGFRRSLYRATYEVKFFNLPLFRFLADQAMIILYFRVAVLTPSDGTPAPAASSLVQTTIWLLLLVFVLYLIWDLLGIWMARCQVWSSKKQKYPEVAFNWIGLAITAVTLVAFGVLWSGVKSIHPDANNAGRYFCAAFVLLLAYRFAKEVRTSWQKLKPQD